MCEFLLGKEADVNGGGIVSKTMWLVSRWMLWWRDIVVVCLCVYVDNHLRFQFYVTGLLGKGMVMVCMCVCRQSS